MAMQPNDWWQSAPLAQPANDPNFSGFIPGASDPTKELQRQSLQLDIKKKQQELNPSSPAEIGDPSTWDTPTKAMVKALAEGRKAFPSGSALRAPYWQDMLARVSEYDPGFDETNYTSRAATRKDFSIGTAGKNIRALNTAIGHLGQLYGQIDRTASHGLVPANVVENAFEKNVMGDSGPTNYASTVSALSGELTAVYRGAGGAEADIQRYINELTPNASKTQKQDTIKNIAGLLNSRLEALQDQYKKGLGVGAEGYQFLDPKAERTLSIINGQTPPAPPAPPAGPNGDGGGGGGDTPPGLSDLSGDQKQAYQAFLAANPTPSGEQVGAFLSKLTGKQVTNGDDIAKAIAKGGGVSTTVEDLTREQKIKQRISQEDKAGLGEDPATTLALHGATLNLSDEAAGVGNALANPLHPIEGYTFGRDVERQRIEDARGALGGAAPVVEFAGGLAAAAPTNALAAITDLPTLMRAGAKGGSVGGALAGFGAGQGAQQSAAGAGLGGASGAAVGALAPFAADRVANMRAPRGMAPDLAAASQAEGVDLLRPMVDPAARGKFGALESAPGSQNVIREGVDRVRGQIEGRIAALGDGGTALETGSAGERVQDAARRFIQRSKGVANTLYKRAQSLAGDARFVPKNAIEAVEAQVAELRANPETNAGEINFLEGLHSDLAKPGGKSVDELRALRQSLRGRINEQGLTSTQAEARAMGVLDAAQQDAAANLPKGAADAYRRADAFYRERMVHIDDILDRFIGGRNGQPRASGEQAFQKLKNMMAPGGDARRLAGLMRDLEPGERQDIAATIAASLGRSPADEKFSADRFLTQSAKFSPQARRTIFGTAGAESVDNLRMLSQKLKEATSDFNRSKTANSMWRLMSRNFIGSITGLGASGFALGGAGGAATGTATAVGARAAMMGRDILSARAMVNPRVSRWLAEAADVSTPSQAKQAVKGLSLVISREPALAHELTPVRDFLDQRVTQLLAADPGPDSKDDQQR